MEETQKMKKIESVAIIGMGALGLMFGQRIHRLLGDEHFCFLMDEERANLHRQDVYKINGQEVKFPIKTPEDIGFCPDLFIVATKYSGLEDARKIIKDLDCASTVISILNGITSEEILAEEIPEKSIIDCIALGMDAVREGTCLTYENIGMLRVGILKSSGELKQKRLDSLVEFFEETGVPYEVREDIKKDMWNKLMMNVGINQTCMVYEATYGEALHESPAKDDLKDAMFEVIKVANLEGIPLTEEDYEWNIKVFNTLNPDGCPSMRQDAMAKRKTEVELFAGTIINLAKKHGISVPVNERFYSRIKEMEADY